MPAGPIRRRLLAALALATASSWLPAPAPAQAPPQTLDAAPFHPSPAYIVTGPATTRGALVWLHGSYDTGQFPQPPREPAFVDRLAQLGWDIWRFDRTPGQDPVAPGGDALIQGLRALRALGYHGLIVAGHSRGAFIALAALRVPGLVNGIALFSPAAHGSRPERRPQAMADFAAALDAAAPQPGLRVVLGQFQGDTLDPDPAGRRHLLEAMCQREGCLVWPLFEPAQPTGHNGVYEPAFDTLFGAATTAFLDPVSPPDTPWQKRPR